MPTRSGADRPLGATFPHSSPTDARTRVYGWGSEARDEYCVTSSARISPSWIAWASSWVRVGAGGVVLGSWLSGVDQPAQSGSQRGAAGPPEGHPPPPPPGERLRPAAPPTLQVNQPHGDGHTAFVVYGRGWPPGTSITVALAGGPTSPDGSVVDRAGAFNYTVNQGHEFFPGALPPGTYTAVVSGGGRTMRVDFLVQP